MGSSSRTAGGAGADTYMIEKLKEILVRLHLPSNTNTNNNSVSRNNGDSSLRLRSSSSRLQMSDSDSTRSSLLYGIGSGGSEGGSDSDSDFFDLQLKRNLNEFIQALKVSLNPTSNPALTSYQNQEYDEQYRALADWNTDILFPGIGSSYSNEYEFNLTDDDINNLNHLLSLEESGSMALKHVVIIGLYICIAIIAIIGNFLVVELVIRSRRLHTLTHALLANLAVADLFMAGLNIPFSISRVVLAEWPFGSFLCQLIPFVQVTSVYVTSITMASIALDRYQVIMNPLGRRMKSSEGAALVFIIWVLSSLLSLPYALHHKVISILTVRVVKRCQADFASLESRQWLTIGTFLTQYLLPLLITSISYISIMHRLGKRSSGLGSATTPRQVEAQSRGKRTTIKMLVLTVIFFAVCFAPINIYHILTHFSIVRHNSTAILVCHLIAMSSTCYNPFIYCWLNEHFRLEALRWLKCFRTKRSPTVHPGIEVNGILTRQDFYRRNQSTNAAAAGAGGGGGCGGGAAGGAMSLRMNPAAAGDPQSAQTGATSSQLRRARLVTGIGAGGKSFSTRMPRGIFPPELLFLTRPSICNIPENVEDEDMDVEEEDGELEHVQPQEDKDQPDEDGATVVFEGGDVGDRSDRDSCQATTKTELPTTSLDETKNGNMEKDFKHCKILA